MKGYNNVFERIKRGQVSTITKTVSKVVNRPCYLTQKPWMTENNFPFLIRLKKQFLRK